MESSTVVAVDDLVVDYKSGRGAAVRAVDPGTPALNTGQVLGVVGESGSGRSTLGKVVAGFLAPTSGAVSFAGPEGRPAPRRSRRPRGHRDIQMIFQESAAALNPRLPVWRLVGEALHPSASLYRPPRNPPSEIVDESAVMYHGQLVEYGMPEQIINRPEAEYPRRLITTVPTLERMLA